MRSKTPEIITTKHLLPAYHGPNGIYVKWYAQLPAGPLVYMGEMEHEVRSNLSALNRLAHACQSRWRGIISISFQGDFL